MTIALDLNRRTDPVLDDTSAIQHAAIKRIADIALPFLSLNATAGQIASIGVGLHRSWTILRKPDHEVKDVFEIAQIAGGIAMSVLFPALYYGVSQAAGMAFLLWDLIKDIQSGRYADAGKDLLRIASLLVHIASVFYAMPEMLALSLLSQALTEFCSALSEFNHDRFPEMLAKAALGCIRVWQAAPHVSTLHRNYLGKTLTQEAWQEIYGKIDAAKEKGPEGIIDVESYLKEGGISSRISNIDFRDTKEMTSLFLQNMRFKNCDFTGVSFEKSHMHNISFDSSLFQSALWVQSVAQNVHFNDCLLKDSAFVQSLAERISFRGCDLTEMAFNSSSLNGISIDRSKMEQTAFLFSQVRDGSIQNSELQDVLFTGTRENFSIKNCRESSSGKPVIALTWDFRHPGIFTPRIREAIQKNDAIALRFEYFPDDIDAALLEQEVHAGLAEIEQNPSDDMLSRPHELLKRSTGGQISKIKQKAEEIFQYIDGLAISGGFDVEPEFYGQTPGEDYWPENDLRRSVTEFAMLDQAYKTKTETMGTCRGSQMINIFMGGDLSQHVDGQWAVFQNVEWTKSRYADLFRPYLGEEVTSYSCHHQAAYRMGKDLEVVLEKDGIPKLFVSKDETFIGSQIHPEIHVVLDKELKEIEKNVYPPEMQPLVDAYIARYKEVIKENQNLYRYFVSKCARRV